MWITHRANLGALGSGTLVIVPRDGAVNVEGSAGAKAQRIWANEQVEHEMNFRLAESHAPA